MERTTGQGTDSGWPRRLAGLTIDEIFVRDDLDAALRFFAATRREAVGERDAPAVADAAATTPTRDLARYRARRVRERLLALIDELRRAVEHRDVQTVFDLLDDTDALRCLPPAVREEALRIAQLPLSVQRAPLRLFRYEYTLVQLGDEPLERGDDPCQLAIPYERVKGEG